METIPKSNCTKIGFIQKPYGVIGELVIRFDEQYYETLEKSVIFFLEIEGLLVPFFPEENGLKFRTGESAIVKLGWIDSEEQAQKFAGLSVFVKNDDIQMNESFLDVKMLEGFLVFDQRKTQIGKIIAVSDFSGNIILEVNYLGKDTMIPFNEDFLIEYSIPNKTITLDLPEGILDLEKD